MPPPIAPGDVTPAGPPIRPTLPGGTGPRPPWYNPDYHPLGPGGPYNPTGPTDLPRPPAGPTVYYKNYLPPPNTPGMPGGELPDYPPKPGPGRPGPGKPGPGGPGLPPLGPWFLFLELLNVIADSPGPGDGRTDGKPVYPPIRPKPPNIPDSPPIYDPPPRPPSGTGVLGQPRNDGRRNFLQIHFQSGSAVQQIGQGLP